MPVEVALPKGRLLEWTESVLRSLDVPLPAGRRYRNLTADGDVSVRLLKMQDVPELVASGAIAIGVAPDEWIAERAPEVQRLQALGWYRARLSLIAADDTPLVTHGEARVVTEYPRVASEWLAGRGIKHSIRAIHGSAEAFAPDLADMIVDCVETGETLRANGLHEIERLFDCDVHVIAAPGLRLDEPGPVRRVVEAITSARRAA